MIRRLVSKADVLREYAKQRAEGAPAAQALKIAQYHCRMRVSPFFHTHDGERVTYKGREFIVRMDHDADAGEPWTNCEPLAGFKSVERFTRADSKLRAGWVWLDGPPTSRAYGYAYNKRAALAECRKWDAHRAESIVQSEIDRFGSWLRDGWRYVSIGLTLRGKTEWLGGVEDDCAEYLAEVLTEHANELLTQEANEYRRETLRRAFC